jgi:hypothetical protein
MERRDFLRLLGGAVTSTSLGSAAAGQGLLTEEEDLQASFFDARTQAAVRNGLAYLAKRQNPDGAFGDNEYRSNAAICALCGMAFLANGSVPGRGPYGLQVQRCVDFVLYHSQESGFICAPEGASRGPMYGHGFATLFLAEVYGMARRSQVRSAVAKAVRLIVDTQNEEGGWRYDPRRFDADISVTVCQVMALRAARNAGIFVPNTTIDQAVAYIRRCQNGDGGFTYRAAQPDVSGFARSAAALVALYGAGIYEGAELRKCLEYLAQHPPRENDSIQQYYYYGHYYAAQAMWFAGGEHWRAWYPAIRDVLLRQQEEEDGSWYDKINSEYGTAMAVLTLHMPSSHLPIFQR